MYISVKGCMENLECPRLARTVWFLNQVHTWFLKITYADVCMYITTYVK